MGQGLASTLPFFVFFILLGLIYHQMQTAALEQRCACVLVFPVSHGACLLFSSLGGQSPIAQVGILRVCCLQTSLNFMRCQSACRKLQLSQHLTREIVVALQLST